MAKTRKPNRARLITINIDRDHNDDGELRWLVTPLFERNGKLLSVPDTRGWETRDGAEAEAKRIRRNYA